MHPHQLWFENLCNKYEISDKMLKKALNLKNYDIVIVADDSSSMCQIDPRSGKSRWQELKEFVSVAIEINRTVSQKPLDIYFLNRRPLLNARCIDNINDAFMIEPEGRTPICKTLKKVYEDKKKSDKLLILIATDGEPTDGEPENFANILKNKKSNTYVNILACTDDKTTVQYFERWDVEIPNLDITDDFYSECDKIKECDALKNTKTKFSFGDYVIKIMVGSTDPTLDNINQKVTSVKSCCMMM